MSPFDLGDTIPDLDFRRPDGSPVKLSELQGDARAVVLVFLRHLA
jgi:peroxiredoxin